MTPPDTHFIGIMFAHTSNTWLATEVSFPSSDLGLKRKRSPGGPRDREAVSGRKTGLGRGRRTPVAFRERQAVWGRRGGGLRETNLRTRSGDRVKGLLVPLRRSGLRPGGL